MLFLALIVLLGASGSPAADREAVVHPDRVKQAVERFVASRSGDDAEETEVTFVGPLKEISVPGGEPELRVAAADGREYRGSCTVFVEVLVKGKVERRVPVSVRVRTFGKVLVSTRMMERHETVGDGDFDLRRVETTSMRSGLVRSGEQLVLKRTSRIVPPGSVLYESMLEPLPIISRGDVVTLRVLANGVVLSVPATAREDGCLGEQITVQKIDSHVRLRGKVSGPDLVEIRTY
jgi:flagella basal body P-ring formation protein FlgA